MRRLILALAAAATIAATKQPPAPPPLPEGVQTAQPAPAEGGYPYLIFKPRGYDADKTQKWPLVIFLHGSGERGTDIEAVKRNGPPSSKRPAMKTDGGTPRSSTNCSPRCANHTASIRAVST
jgi:hypothetical protein